MVLSPTTIELLEQTPGSGILLFIQRLLILQKTNIMTSAPIIVEQTYNAPADQVWNAITDRDEMQQWYFDLAEFKPEVGFKFTFEGGPPEKMYMHLCEITEVIKERKLQYSWRYDGYEGISYVTFELFPDGQHTIVRLTHEGVESFPKDNPDLVRENFVKGWTEIMGTNLRDYLK